MKEQQVVATADKEKNTFSLTSMYFSDPAVLQQVIENDYSTVFVFVILHN